MNDEAAPTTNHVPRIRVRMEQVGKQWRVALWIGRSWRYLHPAEAHDVADKLHDTAEKVEGRNHEH